MGNGTSVIEAAKDDKNKVSGDSYVNKIKEQRYNKLKKLCMTNDTLFKDDFFPPSQLSFVNNIDNNDIKWLRPNQIVQNPKFVCGAADRYDIAQGKLNNCWFLSSLSVLTTKPTLLRRVVPNQSFRKSTYAGIFYFNLFLYDKWISVVVDDLLPTYKGELIFAHSGEKNEFWVALLEKAYAKMKGSYEVLNYGHATESLFDLTGGITEHYKFTNKSEIPTKFFKILYQTFLRSSLICITIGNYGKNNEKLKCGLITMHCYALTNVARLDYNGRQIELLCIKNPWDNEITWNGAWSNNSKEWKSVSRKIKRKIGWKNTADNGEFWISYDDFIKYFNVFEFCHMNIPTIPTQFKWYSIHFEGQWIKNVNAGGCVNNRDTFITNPKYLLNLVDPDAEDDEDLCTIIISLMQKNYRYRMTRDKEEIQIGFFLYYYGELDQKDIKKKTSSAIEMKPNDIDNEFFRLNLSIARIAYMHKKEISCRYRLKTGRYIIIPTTFLKNQENGYMLRIYLFNK